MFTQTCNQILNVDQLHSAEFPSFFYLTSCTDPRVNKCYFNTKSDFRSCFYAHVYAHMTMLFRVEEQSTNFEKMESTLFFRNVQTTGSPTLNYGGKQFSFIDKQTLLLEPTMNAFPCQFRMRNQNSVLVLHCEPSSQGIPQTGLSFGKPDFKMNKSNRLPVHQRLPKTRFPLHMHKTTFKCDWANGS